MNTRGWGAWCVHVIHRGLFHVFDKGKYSLTPTRLPAINILYFLDCGALPAVFVYLLDSILIIIIIMTVEVSFRSVCPIRVPFSYIYDR